MKKIYINDLIKGHRPRRLRSSAWIRELIKENCITVNDVIMPIFIVEGIGIKEPIKAMPGIFRYSIDQLDSLINEAMDWGIKAIALFPNINLNLRNSKASQAINQDNLVCRALQQISSKNSQIGIMVDVALDPFTDHGNDGLLINNNINNDLTIEMLCKQAVNYAQAGANIIAPSDMMDGRIAAIRQQLDQFNHSDIIIASYAAKYASALYGPFREAIQTVSVSREYKKTYQMDPSNSIEATREVILDNQESADLIIIKPAGLYGDIITRAADISKVPVIAYQVSGEYSMIKFAGQKNVIDMQEVMIESILCLKRSGARGIITYFALEVAKIINNKNYC